MIAWLAATAVLAAADWFAVATDNKRLEYLCKPATMVALIGVAASLDPFSGAARTWFVVAIALSLLGDVFLMLPSDRFVPGLASFLLAHVAYIVGLNIDGGSAGALAVSALVVATATVIVATPIVRAVWRGDDPMVRGPVVVYIAVIATMVTSALATGRPLAILGSLLFYGSDATIAWNRFVRPFGWARLFIIVTYHLGQTLLVLSLR
jgi:uncharacterized membrane protein YhhN